MHVSSFHPFRCLLLFFLSIRFLLPTIFASTLPLRKTITYNTTTPNHLPTIVLLTDAFHIPRAYESLIHDLSLLGFNIATWRLPSVDSPTPRKQSVAIDAIFIRQAILLPRIDSGAEVVMLMHSYGGAPGSMAARGLSVEERRRAGLEGGVLGLIFICGILVKERVTLRDLLDAGRFEEWMVQYVCHSCSSRPGLVHVFCPLSSFPFPPNPRIKSNEAPPSLTTLQSTGVLSISAPLASTIFYNDLPPSSPLLAPAISYLRNQSLASLETPTSAPAWADAAFDNRRSYLRTEIDRVIPLRVQQAMLRDSGVRWHVAGLGVLGGQVGHAPFLSRPRELAGWVGGEVGRWMDEDVARELGGGQTFR